MAATLTFSARRVVAIGRDLGHPALPPELPSSPDPDPPASPLEPPPPDPVDPDPPPHHG